MPSRSKKDRRLATREHTDDFSQEITLATAYREGPLPAPSELERYEVLLPGATKMLFDNFIAQTNHRMSVENTVIAEDMRRSSIGQVFSFILSVLVIGVSVLLFCLGKTGPAIAAVVAALAPIYIAFFGSMSSRRKDIDTKKGDLGVE